ncbi:MAG TPA: outer membrane lipoprotein-sorting protein, partial [Candidatus Angelobacter sp.]|nr:outer membrane lipoprotein-sorting protein [Candidatus Angelobacter sp.]
VSAQTVDELIAKTAAARGGLAKLKAVQTVRLTGNFETNGIQAGFVEVAKRPNKLRRDITVQGMNMIQSYDGHNGWQIIPFTGKTDPEIMTGDDLKGIQEEADTDGPLLDYKTKGNKVELVGKEKVNGKDAYNLKVTLSTGTVRNIYLDTDTFFAVKTSAKVTRGGTESTVESFLSDYKEANGIMVPFTVAVQIDGGATTQKITFEKVEFNVAVDDAVFIMPAPAPPATPKP